MVSHRRAELICRLDAMLVIRCPGSQWMRLVALHGRTLRHGLSRHGALAMIVGLVKKQQGVDGEPAMLASLRARLACRAGMATTTAGVAGGFVQGNLAILPGKPAASFSPVFPLHPAP